MVGGVPWEHLVNATGGAGENVLRKHFAHFITLSKTTSPALASFPRLGHFCLCVHYPSKGITASFASNTAEHVPPSNVCHVLVAPDPTEFRWFYNLSEKQYGSAIG